MIQAKYIQKFRDSHNRIYGYRLQDQQGNTKEVYSDQLKTAIANKQINIINLTLTADNRLIDTQPTVQNIKLEQKIQTNIIKGALIGWSKPEVLYRLACQVGFKDIIELSTTDIYGNKAELNTHFKNYKDALQHPEATIFVTNMKLLFNGCEEQNLDLSNFNTSNVTDMSDMFHVCDTQTLDISNFDTSNVTNMSGMFDECRAQILDLSSFNTSNVTDMSSMFYLCIAQTLDLSNFDTSNVTDMNSMFFDCKAQTIDLSNFDTSNVTNMICMFNGCKAQTIDLSNFDTSNVIDMKYMFDYCKAQIKTTDERILEKIQKIE